MVKPGVESTAELWKGQEDSLFLTLEFVFVVCHGKGAGFALENMGKKVCGRVTLVSQAEVDEPQRDLEFIVQIYVGDLLPFLPGNHCSKPMPAQNVPPPASCFNCTN